METAPFNIDIESLFWKFFANEASESEKHALLDWVKASEANKQAFQEARTAFISAKHAQEESQFDSRPAFQQFQAATRPKRISLWSKLSIAAGIAIAAGIGFTLTRSQAVPQAVAAPLVYTCADTQTLSLSLPDKSSVKLHRAARLSYDTASRSERKAVLSGEAFFEVAHDAQKPFTVEAQGICIRVLGTSFVVDAKPQSPTVSVRVLSGRVLVTAKGASQILSANQIAVFHKETQAISTRSSFDHNDIAWKTDELSFNATPLPEVAQKLGKYFGKPFVIADTVVAAYQLTVDFTKPDLPSTLQLLQLAFYIDAIETDSAVILKDRQR